jgi:general secretion pathway protein A
MYLTHWGLDQPPFPSGLDPHGFYEGASQRESLARLRFLLAHRRRLGLVQGGTGYGKSLLLKVFAQQCRAAGHAVAHVDLLGLSARELYWQLGNALHATVSVADDMLRLFRQLTDRLRDNTFLGKQTVLVLDDLDQVGPDLLNHIQRLLRTETADQGWLTVVASAHTQHTSRIGKELLKLVDLRIDLEAWDELDTIGHLQNALIEAGAERPLFDETAVTEIHRAAAGVPFAVNRLADLALLEGASHALHQVDEATILSASEALTQPDLV